MPGLISPLAGDKPPHDIPSGTVRLYEDDNWTSATMDLRIDDDDTNLPEVEYNIIGTWMQDQASYAAFNLPLGVVVTLTEHSVPRLHCANYAGCGKTVDLVGSGETVGVNLTHHFNDTMSAWFWRQVDLDLGAVELYYDLNFQGIRTVIFLSDWETLSLHHLSNWWINGQASSAKWHTIDDRVNFTLWQDDGTGAKKILSGSNKHRENPDFTLSNMDNNISSFQWSGVLPRKEIIKSIQLPLAIDMGDSRTYRATTKYRNETDMEQEFEVTLERADAETLTVSTEDSNRVGFGLEVGYSTEEGEEAGVVSSKATALLKLSLLYDYNKPNAIDKTATKTTSIAFTKVFKAVSNKTTIGNLMVRVGNVPRTNFETTARRWYAIALPGSKPDPACFGWYVRDEKVKGFIEGKLCMDVEIHAKVAANVGVADFVHQASVSLSENVDAPGNSATDELDSGGPSSTGILSDLPRYNDPCVDVEQEVTLTASVTAEAEQLSVEQQNAAEAERLRAQSQLHNGSMKDNQRPKITECAEIAKMERFKEDEHFEALEREVLRAEEAGKYRTQEAIRQRKEEAFRLGSERLKAEVERLKVVKMQAGKKNEYQLKKNFAVRELSPILNVQNRDSLSMGNASSTGNGNIISAGNSISTTPAIVAQGALSQNGVKYKENGQGKYEENGVKYGERILMDAQRTDSQDVLKYEERALMDSDNQAGGNQQLSVGPVLSACDGRCFTPAPCTNLSTGEIKLIQIFNFPPVDSSVISDVIGSGKQ